MRNTYYVIDGDETMFRMVQEHLIKNGFPWCDKSDRIRTIKDVMDECQEGKPYYIYVENRDFFFRPYEGLRDGFTLASISILPNDLFEI